MSGIFGPSSEVVKDYQYTLYGEITEGGNSDFENEIGFTGSITDETGLNYMHARFYNSNTGRFISEDSFGGYMAQPWTQNLYSYCGNNPVSYVDPSGHSRFRITTSFGFADCGSLFPSDTCDCLKCSSNSNTKTNDSGSKPVNTAGSKTDSSYQNQPTATPAPTTQPSPQPNKPPMEEIHDPILFPAEKANDAVLLYNRWGAAGFGHIGLLLADDDSNWYHVYHDTTVYVRKVGKMGSLDDLNNYLSANTDVYKSPYTDAIYVSGNFTESLNYSLAVNNTDTGYCLITNNCMQQSIDTLLKGQFSDNRIRELLILSRSSWDFEAIVPIVFWTKLKYRIGGN